MKIEYLRITFKYFTERNDGLINGRTREWLMRVYKEETLISYAEIEIRTIKYCQKHYRGSYYMGIIGVDKIYE